MQRFKTNFFIFDKNFEAHNGFTTRTMVGRRSKG